MKKKIGLITEYKKAVAEYIAQIRSVFGELVTITPYNFEDDSIHNMGEETIFFVSAVSSSKFRDIKKMLPEGSVIIPAVLSLPKKSLVALNAYDKGRHGIGCISFTVYPGHHRYHGDERRNRMAGWEIIASY